MAENNEQQEVSPIQQVGSNTLCGSVSQYVRPDLMKDDQFQDMSNMRQDKFGVLREISLAETIEKYGSNKLTLESGTKKIFLWRPNNKYRLSSDNLHELILAWVENESDVTQSYLGLYYYSDTDNKWNKALNRNDVIFKVSLAGEPQFAQVNYGVVMVNGRKNNIAYSIETDKDGDLVYGQVGITPPLRKLTIGEIKDYTGDNTQTGVRKNSSLQYCYTYKTFSGNESNPSPIASHISTLPPEYDDDGLITGWISSVAISGLQLHEKMTEEEKEQIEYFIIYRRAFFGTCIPPESSATVDSNATWGKVATIDVGQTSFSDTSAATSSLSYENDKAQKGDIIAVNNNQIFIGNSTSYLSFPFDFKYYMPIKITNSNSLFYAGINVVTTIPDKNASGSVCRYLDWIEALSNLNSLRLYAPDMTTALPVTYDTASYNALSTEHKLKISMSITYGIPPYMTQTFYLAWGGTGVNIADLQTAGYGKWVAGSVG